MSNPIQITGIRQGEPYNALLSGGAVSFAMAAAQLYGQVLAAGAPGGALDAAMAFDMGRTLGLRGHWEALISVGDNGDPELTPADLWINNGRWTGTTRPLSGDLGNSVAAPDAAIVSVRLPGGQPPLARLNPAHEIGERLEGALIAEAETPVVNLIGTGVQLLNTPAKTRQEINDSLEAGVETGKRVMVTPTDVETAKIGKVRPDPSENALRLREQLRTDVEAAYGVQGLLSGTEGSSTALSAVWRVAVVRAFDPLANLCELELDRKIGGGIRFNRSNWIAAPHSEIARAVAQRAGAAARLIAAGIDADRALALCGMSDATATE